MLDKYRMFIDSAIIFLAANKNENTSKEFLVEKKKVEIKVILDSENCAGYCLFDMTFFHFYLVNVLRTFCLMTEELCKERTRRLYGEIWLQLNSGAKHKVLTVSFCLLLVLLILSKQK